jgi:saccharopine dehydrogenase (NADP+, L-glutamate forming)
MKTCPLTQGIQDTYTATLEILGDPKGPSAMARTVGMTCGIATQLFLDGCPSLPRAGVVAPYSKDVCDPIRSKLEKEGIILIERKL